MFFRDNEDDIARRKAENDDRSMFFHSDEEDGEDESLFWSSKNKISYDELYGGETGKRIFENTAKRFEKLKNNNTNIKNKNTDLWRANKGEKYYYIKLDVISYEDKIEDNIEENKAFDVNNYISGNYFKTLEIAKQVLNSDVWKNRFKKYRKDIKRVQNSAYFTINLHNPYSLYSVYGDFYNKYDNKNYNESNYFNEFDEVMDFLKNHLENSQNEIKNFVKNITDEDFILNENEYQNENIINEENYDKTYKKTYNNSYWRAEKGRVYFTIDYNFVKANNELYSSEDYYIGNYFKTLEINLDEKRHKLGNFFGNYEEAEEVKETLWIETWKNIRDIVNKNLGYGYKQENLVEAIQVTKENISDIIKMLEINDEKSFNYIVNEADELEEIWYKENPCSNENVIIVKANSYIVKFSEVGNKPRLEFYTEEEFKRKFKNLQNY